MYMYINILEKYGIMNDDSFIIVGEAVSPNDNVGSSSHGSRTSENTTHSAELAIPITTVHVPSPSPSFQYSRVTSNLRNLFKPYGTSKGRGRGVNLPQPSASLSTWTHKFICLSSKDSVRSSLYTVHCIS